MPVETELKTPSPRAVADARTTSTTLILLFGVVLPVIAWGVELSTRICTSNLFDPIPDLQHALLLLIVPLANLLVISVPASTLASRRRALGLLNGAALAVSTIYSLIFAPLMPLSAIAVVFMGLGLLSLSPMFSLVATIACHRRLRHALPEPTPRRVPGWITGVMVVLAALTITDIPEVVTHIGLKRATSSSSENSIAGIQMLRRWGSEDILLQRCYERPTAGLDPLSLFLKVSEPVAPLAVRPIYYRVTGRPFNAVEPPVPSMRRGWLAAPGLGWFDSGLGGSEVGGAVGGLMLASSVMDGRLDPDAAQAYVEWTLVFQNDARRNREARATVQLPPGGVVSRVTLWIDGQPQEAAFGGRSQTRQAYQRVVRRRRDPLLVSTAGPDQVLVQCFPVPADGGRMKIRLGITAPLPMTSTQRAHLVLPSLAERNFTVPRDHHVWVESTRPVQTDALHLEDGERGRSIARGELSDMALRGADGVIHAERDPAVETVWCELRDDPGALVRARIGAAPVAKASTPSASAIFVIDMSVSMANAIPHIAAALTELGPGLDARVLVAGDEVVELDTPTRARDDAGITTASTWAGLARELNAWEPVGGCDSVAALRRAWELCDGRPGGTIVWLHGPQPMILEPVEPLLQGLQRRPSGPGLLMLQMAPGPQRVAQALAEAGVAERIPRLGSVPDDLGRLVARFNGQSRPGLALRERMTHDAWQAAGSPGVQVSDDLARLWVHTEVLRLSQDPSFLDTARAMHLAITHQLVTPVSGAVVLETAKQYEDAGLTPSDATTVPTVPEPEMIALISIVLALLALTWWRQRRRVCPA